MNLPSTKTVRTWQLIIQMLITIIVLLTLYLCSSCTKQEVANIETSTNVSKEYIEPYTTYVVKLNDTLWDIAANVYGNPTWWPLIWKSSNPDLIKPGDNIEMPLSNRYPSEVVQMILAWDYHALYNLYNSNKHIFRDASNRANGFLVQSYLKERFYWECDSRIDKSSHRYTKENEETRKHLYQLIRREFDVGWEE